jgi:hypothetical protein
VYSEREIAMLKKASAAYDRQKEVYVEEFLVRQDRWLSLKNSINRETISIGQEKISTLQTVLKLSYDDGLELCQDATRKSITMSNLTLPGPNISDSWVALAIESYGYSRLYMPRLEG